ncbi:MAG: hypothetical protein KF883_04745 [Thermomicrobiales bacterium]|nr:hypothetical protein [Thermomicrobiales bacterium]
MEWEKGEEGPTKPKSRNENPVIEKYYFDSMAKINESYLATAAKIHDSYLERAKLIQTYATAIGALYTGLLGWVFIAGDKAVVAGTERLPKSGVIPTAFLAAAIDFAAAFTSFLAPRMKGDEELGFPIYEEDVMQRRNMAEGWITNLRLWRIAFMQLAVLSLGLGVAFLPVAFLKISEDKAFDLARNAVIGTSVVWAIGWIVYFALQRFRARGHSLPRAENK